jgi:hypothetical protein
MVWQMVDSEGCDFGHRSHRIRGVDPHDLQTLQTFQTSTLSSPYSSMRSLIVLLPGAPLVCDRVPIDVCHLRRPDSPWVA